MYAITGATGNTGSIIANTLLDAGKKVRIISRHASQAADLIRKGAEPMDGNMDDLAFLARAFNGAKAVYALIPQNWQSNDYTADQVRFAETMASAAKAAGVTHVVTLSSQGAHLESGSGVVLGLHKMEQAFNALEGVHVLHLRPGYFMENTLGMTGMAKHMGILGSPVKSDLPFAPIATRDIGRYAAQRLLDLDFTGKGVQDLLGPRNVTYAEMASVYGTAIGQPELPYVEVPHEDFKKAFMGMGASENFADNMLTFVDAMNSGKVQTIQPSPQTAMSTDIRDFAEVFRQVYEAQS